MLIFHEPGCSEKFRNVPSSWFYRRQNSPGHNQIWIYDDVNHICKMAPTPRNTREGHFLALCCA